MNLHNEHSSRHLRLRWHISANELQLKALKLAPPNSLRSGQYRQLEHERALLEAELRLQSEIDLLRKYDPDQPREPAGIPEGGQWISLGPSAVGLAAATAMGTRALVEHVLRKPDEPGSKPLKEGIEEFNRLSKQRDPTKTPIFLFRPKDWKPDNPAERTTTRPSAEVKLITKDQVKEDCPEHGTVQNLTNLAKNSAGKAYNYSSPVLWGTAVHSRMKELVDNNHSGQLIAERSFVKYNEDVMDDPIFYQRTPSYGEMGSIRIDVLGRVHDDVVCVYDIKTGRSGLSFPRVIEIGESVSRRYPTNPTIIVTEVRPDQ
ncbi:hypothetical protein [Phyllobacterium myrsinacearum]|uniref:Uncharacterized protein n=1 Tax=Phyllobacterium myrsinacearum TaxID=28101 RepID=A0A839EAJ8_9HYPH|nr:hypothetical protein [Phyllobacterium myrsinacearum]MBA8876901.1 hypothetical protein [Phyllobacterium myrsinacearum]